MMAQMDGVINITQPKSSQKSNHRVANSTSSVDLNLKHYRTLHGRSAFNKCYKQPKTEPHFSGTCRERMSCCWSSKRKREK